jgi:hypothetical protein
MKKFSEQILDALKEGVELHGSAYKLAKASGVQLPTLGRWLEGTPPRLAAVEPVMDALHAQIVLPGRSFASYEFIACGLPYLDENGLLQIRERPHAPIALERHWLRNADIHPASSVMVEVADNSMEPLFSTGDLVLVDRADLDPRQGRIYLLSNAKGEIMFRRLKSEAGMGWTLLPENPAWSWAHETVPDISHIQIHGRVRWSSRMF